MSTSVQLDPASRVSRARSRRVADASGPARNGHDGAFCLDVFRADPVERIRMIKQGVLASEAKRIITYVSHNQRDALEALSISSATLNRKMKDSERLPAAESERVLGVARLVGQVRSMVEEGGDPEGFDAHAWLTRWLGEPLPALGGVKPRDMLDTIEGQKLVSEALARIRSGAYA